MKLLAVDIGNTNINFAIFEGKKIVKKFLIPAIEYNFKKLQKFLLGDLVKDTIICSVVPKATGIVEKDLLRITGKPSYILGKNVSVPIKNLYRKPKQVGQDRLVNACAGVKLLGAPLIAVDFGTAITFDVISKNGQYLGGMIIPGLNLSLNALSEKTALLPKIRLGDPREFIGKDTKNRILSGIVYGMASLTDDLVKRIKEKIGRNAKVIATGGNIDLISRYCKELNKIDKDLTLKGLNWIYQENGNP